MAHNGALSRVHQHDKRLGVHESKSLSDAKDPEGSSDIR
jgi:hypothetical protein